MQPLEIYMSMLGDEYDDIKANVAYNNAISAIKNYIRKDEINVEEEYPYAVIQLAFYYYKNFDNIHIQNKSQGGRSATLVHDIPKEIKAMLPRYVKVF